MHRAIKPGRILRQRRLYLAAVVSVLILPGCSSGPEKPHVEIAQSRPDRDGAPLRIPRDLDLIPDAVPRYEVRTRAGNPDSYEVFGQRYYVLKDSRDYAVRGLASWYGTKFHGLKTSNGENYDMFAMTAAHKTLPIPCYARVTNLDNGRAVTVRINDRGPFHDDRVIDLSYTAAYKLGILEQGTGYVEVRTVEPTEAPPQVADHAKIRALETSQSAMPLLFVQVGAFSDPANARKLQLQLQLSARQLAQPHVRPVAHRGGWLYRVQLGPVAGMEQANQLANQLSVMGITQTSVVVEQSNFSQSMLE